MADRRGPFRIAFTFDLHDVDHPDDIAFAAEWFRESGHAATFFVPSAMLTEPRYTWVLRRLPELGHEVGSHGHLHDWAEIEALMKGAAAGLSFLAESRDRHAQFFGRPPSAFRSPRWCRLGAGSIDALRRLDYVADSSATPQRVPIFSSKPFHPGWWSSGRSIHELAPGLAEVPTSTLLVPAGAPTFLTLRRAVSHLYLALLEAEARLTRGGPLVLQFHVEDFTPGSRRDRTSGPLSWRDFRLRPQGGFRFKLFLRDADPASIVRTHRSIVGRYRDHVAATISDLARDFLGAPTVGPAT